MNAETKKYLTYGGVAILVGSLGYFIYSTLSKKPLVVDNTQVIVGEDENTNQVVNDNPNASQSKNLFTEILDRANSAPTSIGYKFPSDFSVYM
jgi:hypothetical protein